MGELELGFNACEYLIDLIGKGMVPQEHHERIKNNHSEYHKALSARATELKLREIEAQKVEEQQKKRRLEQQKKTSESKKITKNRAKEKARRKANAK